MKSHDIRIKDVATYPLPGTAIPSRLVFSPDNKTMTNHWSAGRTLTQQAYIFDPETGDIAFWLHPQKVESLKRISHLKKS